MDAIDEKGFVVDGVFYSVPDLRILQGIYLKVEPGSICALFGRNGCGKTTLLKVAAGQIQPDSGIVIIDGERFHKKSNVRRYRRMAYLPQDSMLPGEQSVKSLIEAFRGADYLFNDALLSRLLQERFRNLSGGEKRYLEVQLLLSLRRSYLLLDEPFTGLEPLMIDRISELLKRAAAEGVGILITDHYHQYILPLADQAYAMLNKQCELLRLGEAIDDQLKAFGYL